MIRKHLRSWICGIGMLMAGGAAHAAEPQMTLSLLREQLAVARLDAKAAVPAWANANRGFNSITRTRQELSIVCEEAAMPATVKREGGYRILRVEGPLDFALVGILASIATPLAKAGISIFVVSTYDTDYVMVKNDKVDAAIQALQAAGHTVKRD